MLDAQSTNKIETSDIEHAQPTGAEDSTSLDTGSDSPRITSTMIEQEDMEIEAVTDAHCRHALTRRPIAETPPTACGSANAETLEVEMVGIMPIENDPDITHNDNDPQDTHTRDGAAHNPSLPDSALDTSPEEDSIDPNRLSPDTSRPSHLLPVAAEMALSHRPLIQEAGRGSTEAKPEISLISRFPYSREIKPWLLALAATVITTFSIYYAYNAAHPHGPFENLLWRNPEWTIFTINLLTYATGLILDQFHLLVCEELRWSYSSTDEGISFLSFLSLSSSASTLGLLHFLFSPFPPARWFEKRLRGSTHRWWSFQRLLLSCLHSVLGVILLFDLSFQPIFSAFSGPRILVPGGVIPFNESGVMQQYPTWALQHLASARLGVLSGRTMEDTFLSSPTLEMTSTDDCPLGPALCVPFYFLQSFQPTYDKLVNESRNNLEFPSTNKFSFLVMPQTPIYHFYITGRRWSFEQEDCHIYGYGNEKSAACIRLIHNKTSTLIGFKSCSTESPDDVRLCSESPRENRHVYNAYRVDIVERYADLTYDLSNKSTVRIENVSDVLRQVKIDSEAYFALYDRIFPKSIDLTSEEYATVRYFLFQRLSAITAIDRNDMTEEALKRYFELLLLPWLIQQFDFLDIAKSNLLPSRNLISASLLKQDYRVVLAPKSFYTFTVFSLFTLSWCLIRQCCITKIPRLSSFPDIDLLEKLPVYQLADAGGESSDYNFSIPLSKLSNVSSKELEKVFDRVYLFVKENDHVQRPRFGYDEGFPLQGMRRSNDL